MVELPRFELGLRDLQSSVLPDYTKAPIGLGRFELPSHDSKSCMIDLYYTTALTGVEGFEPSSFGLSKV